MTNYTRLQHLAASYRGYVSNYPHRTSNSPTCRAHQARIEDLLLDVLPHGSGLDTEWEFEWYHNGHLDCNIYYHAMNHNGYYVKYYPVKIKLWRAKDGKLKYKLYCTSTGYYAYMLHDSLFETFHFVLFPLFEYSDKL